MYTANYYFLGMKEAFIYSFLFLKHHMQFFLQWTLIFLTGAGGHQKLFLMVIFFLE